MSERAAANASMATIDISGKEKMKLLDK